MDVLGFLYPSREHIAWLLGNSAQCFSSPITSEVCGKFWASLALACVLAGIFFFFLAALEWWLHHPLFRRRRHLSPKSDETLVGL